MAGIGFELKKLYSKKGMFAKLRAAGYSAAVCTGPMVLGTLLLLGIMAECNYFHRDSHERELLVCMTTYSLLGSLLLTSIFSMIVTRFLADMLFIDQKEAILPSFFGVNAVTLLPGGIVWGVFLFFSGAPFRECFFVWCFFMELIVTWNSQNYLTAVKEYAGILVSYILAIGSSLSVAFLLLWLGVETVCGVLISLCLGYGIMLLYDFALIFRRFPDSNISPFLFFRWADRYGMLGAVGFCSTFALFAHLILMWLGPLQVVVEGLWVGAPFYDVPALLAFVTILPTNVSFVVSLEVNFYPKYRDYYALYNDQGTLEDILRVEGEMLTVLRSELWYTGFKQFLVSVASISLSPLLLSYLPLGFNDLMFGYFRTLTVGYGIYAVANTMLLVLLYFTDYSGALASAAVFLFSTIGFTALLMPFDERFYGFGFLAGGAVFFVFTVLRLGKFTSHLSYYVLAAQPIVSESKAGMFTRLGALLEKNAEEGSAS